VGKPSVRVSVSDLVALCDKGEATVFVRRCVAAIHGFRRTDSLIPLGIETPAQVLRFLRRHSSETWWVVVDEEPLEILEDGSLSAPQFQASHDGWLILPSLPEQQEAETEADPWVDLVS